MDHTATTLRSRRALLLGSIGGVAAIAATALGRPTPAWAGTGDPVLLGTNNASVDATRVTTAAAGNSAIWGSNTATTGAGRGLRGETAGAGTEGNPATGVWGRATNTGNVEAVGVLGEVHSTGVSEMASGVWGRVGGTAAYAAGVRGTGYYGVHATGTAEGVGVYSAGGTGGIFAGLDAAVVLAGNVAMTQNAGVAKIFAGQKSVVVAVGNLVDVRPKSPVFATLLGSAGGATTVHRIAKDPANDTITIYLTKNATQDVFVSWLVLY